MIIDEIQQEVSARADLMILDSFIRQDWLQDRQKYLEKISASSSFDVINMAWEHVTAEHVASHIMNWVRSVSGKNSCGFSGPSKSKKLAMMFERDYSAELIKNFIVEDFLFLSGRGRAGAPEGCEQAIVEEIHNIRADWRK